MSEEQKEPISVTTEDYDGLPGVKVTVEFDYNVKPATTRERLRLIGVVPYSGDLDSNIEQFVDKCKEFVAQDGAFTISYRSMYVDSPGFTGEIHNIRRRPVLITTVDWTEGKQ